MLLTSAALFVAVLYLYMYRYVCMYVCTLPLSELKAASRVTGLRMAASQVYHTAQTAHHPCPVAADLWCSYSPA